MSIAGLKTSAFFVATMLAAGSAAWSPLATAQAETSEPAVAPAPAPAPDAAAQDQTEAAAPSSSAEQPDAPAESTVAGTAPVIPVQETAHEAETPPAVQEQGKEGAMQLDTVVVTARKRQESIQDVPLSVTAFSSKQMEQRGFTGLSDIAAATPGFTFEGFATGGAHGNPVIRGLANQFTTTRIQNVSFFLDGVYLQRQSMLNLGMLDMERIEVVKGPQNALYGRNAFAGAVNYVTLQPSNQTEGYLMATIGDNQRREYRFSINGPLNEAGTVYGKFTVGTGSYDGDTANNHPISKPDFAGPHLRGNLGGYDDTIYSLSLGFEPIDELKVRGSYYHNQQQHESPASYSISGINAARFGLRYDSQDDLNCNRVTVKDIGNPSVMHTGNTLYCGELPRYASDISPRTRSGIVIDPRAIGTLAKTSAVTLTADYTLNPAMSLHYLFGMANHGSYTDGGASDEDPLAGRGITTNALITSVDNTNPNGYTFANTSSARPNSELKSFSHEVRLDWQVTDSLRTSFGGYYSGVRDAEWTELFIMDLCNDASAENIRNCNRPITTPNTIASKTVLTSGIAYDQYTRQSDPHARGEWTQYHDVITAIFASASFAFTEHLNGTLESRFNVEKKNVNRLTDDSALAPGQTVTYNPPQYPVLPGVGNSLTSTIVVPQDSARFADFTPRAILNWSYAPGHMVYGSAAKGTKTGGFNNANTPEELKYAEEENWTYELGSKNVFFHHVFTLNGAVFYTDWTKIQAGVPPAVAGLSTSDIITNLAGATTYGAEIDSKTYLTEAFSVDLALSYGNPKYKQGVKFSAGNQTRGNFHCNGVTCPVDGDISGNQLSRTSKKQASLGLNYLTYVAGWTVNTRLDGNYQSKQYVEPLNLAWVPARTLVNASFNLQSPDAHWEIGGWGKNLTNEDYASNSFLIGVFNQYMVGKGPLRTFGANLKYKF